MKKSYSKEEIIQQTINWIKMVVIGCNFCPFASKAMLQKSIRYVVHEDAEVANTLEVFSDELKHLDKEDSTETTLIILSEGFDDFENYLDLVRGAERLNRKSGYDGVYQVASFHPDYRFEGSDETDPANYTNRSIYPMLHILREESVSQAVDNFPDAENIPFRNIEFARRQGLEQMKLLRALCFNAE